MMSGANRSDDLELDCFLEVEGVGPADAEQVAVALAEELDRWVETTAGVAPNELEAAIEIGKQLRLLGWLVNADLGGDRARMLAELEMLAARMNELVLPPVVSGVRRRVTPPLGLPMASLYGADDDEQTVVKKAKWSASRNTNRALAGEVVVSISEPPPPFKKR